MSIEARIRTALLPISPGRVWSDVAPKSALTPPLSLFITYVQVGGQGRQRIAGPDTLRRPRFQINVWGGQTRIAASDMMRAAEAALHAATHAAGGFVAVAQGDAQATWDEDTATYGAMQDFSVAWRP